MMGTELEVGATVTVLAGIAKGEIGRILGWYLDTGDVLVGSPDGRVVCFPEDDVAPAAR